MVHIIGHRGGRNLWAENSMTGFRELAKMSAEGVEFDVHLTIDGEMLVIHDPTLDRTTEHTGPVSHLRKGKHKQVALKNGNGDTIPLLEDVLTLYAASDFELHVELKADSEGNPYTGMEARVAAILDSYGLAHRSILTSFNPEVLGTVRKVAPHIRTLSSYDAKSAEKYGLLGGIEHALQVSDIIAIEKTLLDQHWDLIERRVPLAQLGVWVPNEEAELSFWLSKPIRQLTTDRPDRALNIREIH
jgi:glycerophosphoryl diester phosphodiesterase